jgi:hypothetical protein
MCLDGRKKPENLSLRAAAPSIGIAGSQKSVPLRFGASAAAQLHVSSTFVSNRANQVTLVVELVRNGMDQKTQAVELCPG